MHILYASTHHVQRQPPIHSTTGRLCKERNTKHLSWLESSGTPRKRSNLQECNTMVLVARHAGMDHTICQRLHGMPTKQSPHSLHQSPPLPHKHTTWSLTVSSHSNGFDYSTPQMRWTWCNSNHSRPRMLPSSSLHSMFHDYYGRRDCQVIFWTHLPMVRPTRMNDLG